METYDDTGNQAVQLLETAGCSSHCKETRHTLFLLAEPSQDYVIFVCCRVVSNFLCRFVIIHIKVNDSRSEILCINLYCFA